MKNKSKNKKSKSIKQLKKDAWTVISKYVRYSNLPFHGLQQCYTCFTWHDPKEMNAGHYIHNKLDFNLDNLKPQCVRCNHFLSGNLGKYAQRLIKENGQNWLDQLEAKAQFKGNNYSKIELEEIIKKYGN